MTRISLVLPFALPPPELAPDLVRALQTPALAALISRSRRADTLHDDSLRTLPYESALARHMGVSADDRPAFAAAVMDTYGIDPAPGTWFIVHPAHIEVARSHLLLHDARGLRLTDAHSRALFDAAKPYVDDTGKTLLYGDAATWFMRADGWTDLSTASPDAAVSLNLTDWLPAGPKAVEFRKLQNEIQMLWFDHPANGERAERGQTSVNGFWPWAPSAASTVASADTLYNSDAPTWLTALSRSQDADLPSLIAAGGDATLVCGQLIESAMAADWAAWLAHMARLDASVFAQALAAVKSGAISLQLLLSDRTRQRELTTTRLAQHAFWRSPTLTALLP